MEITTMKWRGAEVHCLFTGYQYVFYNNFWGILAVADRDETNEKAFTVRYGNEKLSGCSLGGNVCALLAERFIRKNESRYISREISFERKREDLRKWYRVSLGEGDESKVYFLEGCDRKNPKRFREFVERMNRNAERIAKAFRAQKFDAVWDYV